MGFAILEITTGFLINSLALLGEGFHMASDGLNLLMSFVAITIGMRAVTKAKPFGFRRIETITAFLNGLVLMIIPVFIVWEAVHRFTSPREIEGLSMLAIASIGLLINLIVAFMLFKADQSSLNIRAAALHVLADLLSSISTIIAALFIMSLGWFFVDPFVSVITSVTIFIGGLKITKEAFNCLMEGTPHNVDAEKIEEEILKVPGVLQLSDFKLWSIASDVNYLMAHIEVDDATDYSSVQKQINQIAKRYNLVETIQIKKRT